MREDWHVYTYMHHHRRPNRSLRAPFALHPLALSRARSLARSLSAAHRSCLTPWQLDLVVHQVRVRRLHLEHGSDDFVRLYVTLKAPDTAHDLGNEAQGRLLPQQQAAGIEAKLPRFLDALTAIEAVSRERQTRMMRDQSWENLARVHGTDSVYRSTGLLSLLPPPVQHRYSGSL